MSRAKFALVLGGLLYGGGAAADPPCRTVEVRFAPQGLPAAGGREALGPQIAVWVEDPSGKFLADVFVTRLVGLFGLGNRPGQALLKSDFRWPYGRRPMALPVWAFGRGKTYGYVVMGGKCSSRYNPDNPRDTSCPPDFTSDPSDDDTTIAYHGPVSSDEPFFCSPSGWRTQQQNGVDVVSCASSFYGSKGWYAPGMKSVYPPRADLMAMGANDHTDTRRFATDNDVAAISGATPPSGRVVDPPLRWLPPGELPDGDYVMKLEVNIEGDFNDRWRPGKSVPEPHREWNHLGKEFIGQPSIVYQVPFRLEGEVGRVTTTADYAGYGDWSGKSGTVNPPDDTISSAGGSGLDRLRLLSDDNGPWRVKVNVVSCADVPCDNPQAPAKLDLSDRTDSTLGVSFKVPAGEPVAQFQVKYQKDLPITPENYDRAIAATSPTLGLPGATVTTRIVGLQPQIKYYIAARSISRCGKVSSLITGEATTDSGKFTTLSGCFIATAAYGPAGAPGGLTSAQAGEAGERAANTVADLRRFRDRHLLTNPLGQALVAVYYSLSPPLAGAIAGDDRLRALARGAINPLADLARISLATSQAADPPSR